MALETRRTIVLKGTGIKKEALADGAVTPGMLLERTSAGKFKKHSTAGGNAHALFAVEDDIQGNGITTDYATGKLVQAELFRAGDEVYAILNDGESIAPGDYLASAGNGKLKKYTVASGEPDYVNAIVAQSLETLDLSGSSGADPASARFAAEIV